MNSNMARVQGAFGDDDGVMLLSHSVTPDIDTVDVLRRYGDRFKAQRGKWHFVTGSRETIYDLGRNTYFIEEDQGRSRSEEAFLHSENLIVVDARGHLRGIYNGLSRTDVDRMIQDIRKLRTSSKTNNLR